MAENNEMLTAGMTANFAEMFPPIMGEDWLNWELNDQVNFRNKLEAYVKAANLCRETFDKQVWQGHETGKVNVKVESIRTKSDGDKPGRKAKVKTAAELLAERLSK